METLTITRLGHLGDGIAEGPVFVPRTLPGERVEGTVVEGVMAQPRIVTPSPDRVRPPCPHYKGCGGCAVQHASDGFVAEWKAQVVRAALAAQGLEAPMRPIATSPANSRRRATLSGRRTKKGAIVGFHGRGSGTLVEIPRCTLLHPGLLAALPALEEITVLGASRKGEIALAMTLSPAGIDLSVDGAKPMDGPLFAALGALAGRHDLARLSWNSDLVAERRPPFQQMGKARVVPPPGAFLQATAHGEAALRNAVTEAVGDDARQVADLFAGCGTFALPLAEGAEVHAVEGAAPLLDALDRGWRKAQGLRRVTTEPRDLFRRPLLGDELSRFDAVVIDPPRAGAEAQVTQIAAAGPTRVAMVSCNPVTFARDAQALVRGGYGLDWVQVVDQFRWSTHVELAAQFTRP